MPHTATIAFAAALIGAVAQAQTQQPELSPAAEAEMLRRAEARWARPPATRPTDPRDRAHMGGGVILENGLPVPLPGEGSTIAPPQRRW